MRTVLISLVFLSAAGAASAQVAPYPGQPYYGASIAEQHRYQNELQRARSQEQAAFARDQELQTRLTLQELQAARQPEPYLSPSYPVIRTPEEERAYRQSATERRKRMQAGVNQIDDWLSRTPPQ